MNRLKWRDVEWWYINLASRPDRDLHAKEQFARHGLPVKRFDAFTPDQWPGDPAKVARMMARTPGAVGCHQSQMAVIKTVVGADIEIWRQLDAESVPTLFSGPFGGVEAPAVNFPSDITLSGERETDVQYFAKHVIPGSTSASALSAAYVQWVGPHPVPGISPIEFIAFTRGISGEIIVSSTFNWNRKAANNQLVTVEWEIQSNTNGAGYVVAAPLAADVGLNGGTKQFTGLTPTDSILYRSRMKHDFAGNTIYSDFSVVSGPVVVP